MTGQADKRLRQIDWSGLDESERAAALSRPAVRSGEKIGPQVEAIIAAVREEGDAALERFTGQFDGVTVDSLRVGKRELDLAETMVSDDAKRAMQVAITNVSKFQSAQLNGPVRVETTPGVVCQRITRPIQSVGLYVPAGSAPLPSTAIMLAVPAQIAACPVRFICTPPNKEGRADPSVLVAAKMCGIEDVFKVGGAQAIAALAYGTETIPKVDKIFGPGNAWVTAAKTVVASDPAGAAQDMPAGPSEVMVIADTDANPDFVALDLLSQAEHGPDSQAILVCTEAGFAERVETAIARALPGLPRRSIIEASLANSACILVTRIEDAFEVANRYAPEHLIIQIKNASQSLDFIINAGSIFLGPWTPESVGDYCSGTNHVLPTYGYARNHSGLSVAAFQKQLTVQELTRDGLEALAPTVRTLAGLEGLDAHAEAVVVRLDTPADDVSS
jgi:histidinol dehydrogenase